MQRNASAENPVLGSIARMRRKPADRIDRTLIRLDQTRSDSIRLDQTRSDSIGLDRTRSDSIRPELASYLINYLLYKKET